MKQRTWLPVIQEEKTGCGIASAAVLSGTSYAVMKGIAQSMGISAMSPSLWSEIAPMQKLLLSQGIIIPPIPTPFSTWKALPDVALIALKWHIHQSHPVWHWSVYVRDRANAFVLDPKKSLVNHRRTDWGRMKPRWFIEVVYPTSVSG